MSQLLTLLVSPLCRFSACLFRAFLSFRPSCSPAHLYFLSSGTSILIFHGYVVGSCRCNGGHSHVPGSCRLYNGMTLTVRMSVIRALYMYNGKIDLGFYQFSGLSDVDNLKRNSWGIPPSIQVINVGCSVVSVYTVFYVEEPAETEMPDYWYSER